jgi:hypothetical protein
MPQPGQRTKAIVALQVVLVGRGGAAAEAQGASSENSASGTQQQSAAGVQPHVDSSQTAAAGDGKTSSGGAGKAAKLPMQDCSTDDSGLPLASLKVEAAWESHGLREDNDITIVTQMSPRRSLITTEITF